MQFNVSNSKKLKCAHQQLDLMPQSHQLLNNVLDANQDLQMVWEQGLLGTNKSDWKCTKSKNIYGGSKHLQSGIISLKITD